MSGQFRSAVYSGKHLILDLFGVEPDKLSNLVEIQSCLEEAAEQAGAQILGTNFHHFGEGFGLTGVVILAESHISIHTWPEEHFAAIDIFMCGTCDPLVSIPRITKYFCPTHLNSNILYRGLLDRVQ